MKKKFDLWVHSNYTLKKLIEELKIAFLIVVVSVTNVFATNTYSQTAKVSIHIANATLEDEILTDLFSNTNIHYAVIDRNILLTTDPLKNDLTEPASRNELQQKRISGKVTDGTNAPLPGVNIVEKGTANGTITDANGNYSLSVASSNAILSVSFIGYSTQEVTVGNQNTVNVVLKESLSSLDEVVVIGYGTAKKSDITGSVSSVSSEQIKLIVANDVRQTLQARAAGVDINYGTRRPGEGASILIRGHRSFSASNDPLYVIDGIPTTLNIGDINTSDIESIEVLKDASATAIYGARAANGVVIIQTRRGKAGKTIVSYDGYYGINKVAKNLDLMTGSQFAEMKREAYRNAATVYYKSPYADPLYDYFDPNGLFRQDPLMWESVRMGYEWEDAAMTIVKRDAAGVPIYHPEDVRNTDWPALITRDGSTQQHQLSISGGTEKTQVLFAITYYNEVGVNYGQDFNRYNIRLNLDHKITDWFKVGVSSNFLSSLQNYGSNLYGIAANEQPLAVPYDNNGNLVAYPGNDVVLFNPLYDIDGVLNERKRNRFYSAVYFELKPLKGLTYLLNLGPDFSNYRNGQFQASHTSARSDGGNYASYQTSQDVNLVMENILTYNINFKERHDLTATLMQSIQSEQNEGSSITATNLPYDYQLWYNIGTAATINSIGSSFTERKIVSFMARLNYSFNRKYLLTLTGRRDGASMLAEDNKYDFFPAAALAWRIGEEDFMQNMNLISDLKLRVGYGKAGNSAISPYQTQGSLARTAQDFGDASAYGYRPSAIPNPDLEWETTATTNLALDFGLFENRVTGTVDVYRSQTSNLLMNMQLPTETGFNSVTMNVGSTQNTGIEAQVSANILSTDWGLNWKTDLLWFTDKEEITELYGGKIDDIGNRWFIGQPISVNYDYVYDGIWQDTPEDATIMAAFNAKGNRFAIGKIKLVDVSGDGVINTSDRAILGNSMPKWTGSWGNTFSYKGFDFTFLLYTRQGAQVSSSAYTKATLRGRTQCADVFYYAVADPNKSNAVYPRPSADFESPEYLSTLGYVDASFVKLRNISLSYSIPREILSKIRMQNLRIYVSGQNFATWTKFKGLDPEGNIGQDTQSTKMFSIGVNATF